MAKCHFFALQDYSSTMPGMAIEYLNGTELLEATRMGLEMKELGAAVPHPSDDERTKILSTNIFRLLDADGSGHLNKMELITGLNRLGDQRGGCKYDWMAQP